MDNFLRDNKRIARLYAGFTLMEMVVVILVIAAIAAFAFPRFADMDTNANQAAVNSVAASLNTTTALNFARRKASTTASNAIKYTDCRSSKTLLPGGVLPTGYSINGGAVAENAEVICKVIHVATGVSQTYVGLGVS